MSVNQGVQTGGREPGGRTETHSEYFESLEAKLLEESQKLTNFMGKSLINDRSKTRLHLALSPSRHHLPSALPLPPLPPPPPPQDKPYLRRVKQLCQKIRTPKTALDDHFRSPQKALKERYENERNLAYNTSSLCKDGKEGKEGREGEEKERPIDRGGTTAKQAQHLYKQQAQHPYKQQRQHPYRQQRQHPYRQQRQFPQRQQRLEMPPRLERSGKLQRSDKMKRLYRMISDSKSLKDTISTESCKSLKSLDQLSTTTCAQRMRLQDFQILKYLAEGKFGSVYLVRHKATNFLCALKRIPSQSMRQDPRILTQRIREIKIQSYLDHPNIVQLYAVFVEEGDLYLLMELCYSGTLFNALRAEGRLSEERIRTVVKQVCYAVEYMHDNDILHRDLKPQNILFHESIAKICDFGWSVNSPLLRDTLCGTPLYSSPEVVQKQQYDNKVDVWNIGVLTYELLYGKVPFEIRTEEDLSKVVDDDIYFPRSKPASLQIKDFILRCLSKNPKERFTIGRLIDHQFLQVADPRPN